MTPPAGTASGRALTASDLDALRNAWVSAAVNAKATGFDGIELHGAHGYLLDQFLWERTNLRSDDYGGTLEDRVRFPAEVVAAIREAVGPDLAIVYRYSQWKANDYHARIAATPDELARVLTPLVRAGVDVLHPSTRRHWEPAFPELSGTDGELGLAGWTRKITGLPTITVGSVGLDEVFTTSFTGKGDSNVTGIDRLLKQHAGGEFDLVALGRALLADPDWVRKLRKGRSEEHIAYRQQHQKTLT